MDKCPDCSRHHSTSLSDRAALQFTLAHASVFCARSPGIYPTRHHTSRSGPSEYDRRSHSVAVGAVTAAWSLVIFRMTRTTPVPGKSSVKLVTWGPYRMTRNPMYVGRAIPCLGEAGLLKQIWPALVLPLTLGYLHWIVIPVEEARLKEVCQDKYEEYSSRVRGWI